MGKGALLLASLCLLASAVHAEPVVVCHNYRCKAKYQITLMPRDLSRLQAVFSPPAADAVGERLQIQQAVGLMERIVAFYTNTGQDLGGNQNGEEETGRMDCIDESTNTTTYLRLFAAHGWLHFHTVGKRVLRHPWLFDDHWTAVVVERGSGARFAVDSWPYDNGVPPLVQPLAAWKRKAPAGPPPRVTIAK